jgi:hypothetical protein
VGTDWSDHDGRNTGVYHGGPGSHGVGRATCGCGYDQTWNIQRDTEVLVQ